MVRFLALSDIVNKYHRKGVIIDSGSLFLLIVGRCKPSELYRLGKYNEKDYQIIFNFLKKFQKIIITPYIIAEVSNLANNKLKPYFEDFINECTSFLKNFEEQQFKKDKILNKKQAQWLGFTDSSIIISSEIKNGLLILTDDDELITECKNLDMDVLNLSSLRATI